MELRGEKKREEDGDKKTRRKPENWMKNISCITGLDQLQSYPSVAETGREKKKRKIVKFTMKKTGKKGFYLIFAPTRIQSCFLYRVLQSL